MPLFGQDSREQTLNHWVEKEGNGIGKEPRDGIRNRVSASAVCRRTNHEGIGTGPSIILIFKTNHSGWHLLPFTWMCLAYKNRLFCRKGQKQDTK